MTTRNPVLKTLFNKITDWFIQITNSINRWDLTTLPRFINLIESTANMLESSPTARNFVILTTRMINRILTSEGIDKNANLHALRHILEQWSFIISRGRSNKILKIKQVLENFIIQHPQMTKLLRYVISVSSALTKLSLSDVAEE